MRAPRLLLALASVTLAVTACGGGEAATPTQEPFVVVLQDPGVPGAREVVAPAILAFSQVTGARGIGIRVVDVHDDDAIRSAAADPSAVAVLEAPYAVSEGAVEEVVGAGLPLLQLSGDEARPNNGAMWRSFVAPRVAEARALSELVGSRPGNEPVCVAGEATPASVDLRTMLARHAPVSGGLVQVGGIPGAAAAAVARQGCGIAIWTGGPGGGAAFRDALRTAAPDVELLLGSQARTGSFLEGPEPSSDGVRAVCACADLSTSEDPVAQAFVHGFQAATGLDAGPFAAEGADAGSLLVRLWDAGARTREELASALGRVHAFRGVGGRYRWDPHGDLTSPPVRIYRAEGFRWLRIRPRAAGAPRGPSG